MGESNLVLIREEGYEGKYVALRSLSDRTVIASGDDPEIVMKKARVQSADEPAILFVPSHDMVLADAFVVCP